MNTEHSADDAHDTRPVPVQHPFSPHPFAVDPAVPAYPTGPTNPGGPWYPGYPAPLTAPTTQRLAAKRPPRWLVAGEWTATVILLILMMVQGIIFAVPLVVDAVAQSGVLGDRPATVLSEVWTVDGVDVVYVEEGGAECGNEYCWEWLLVTQPDCTTATVTVGIWDDMYAEPQREITQTATIERVTSILVDATPMDGDYAELTSVSCD